MAIQDTPLDRTLEELVLIVEAQSASGMLASILLLDNDGLHLRHGAAPNMPQAYNDAIDGIAIGPGVGSCGVAAYSKGPVYVSDIAIDPLWADFRDLALSHGLRACWSTPILSARGEVLGTFALYYGEPREPASPDLKLIDFVTRSAALVIERKQAEEALRESEENFRAIADTIPQLVWMAEGDGSIFWYNQRWYDYTGATLETMRGWGWRDVHHPAHIDRIIQEVQGRWAGGKAWEDTYLLRSHAGEYRWFLTRAEPIRNEVGEVVRWFGTNTDIQESVEMREELARHREELEVKVVERTQERDRLWNLSRDPFLIADTGGRWLSVSPVWTDLLGWTEQELLGRTSEWMEHPDDRKKTRAEVDHLSSGEQTLRFENRFRTKDGNYRWFSWTAVPEGNLLYAVARDVTSEKEKAEELEKAQEALRQSQKMEAVGQLTGGVAHDFNNLLQIVTGNLDILQRHLPEDATRLRRSANNAMTGAKRAALLTQRLLAFSRRQPLEPKPISVNRLVTGMSDLLGRTLGETIEIETILSGGLWQVEADANQLESAILNLAVNARDAMPDGGKLTIETANTHLDRAYAANNVEVAPGQYVVICVTDTGAGMDAEAMARAFEPFFTTKEIGRGTGLGLSQVYGFVKQSSGHVKIYSEPGEGTTVKIYLPRLIAEAAEDVPAAEQLAPEGSRAETILVVEDDDDVRAYSVEVLRELGYRVLEAHDGPSAIRLLERQESGVDLLFTDVVLPGGMTGSIIAERARVIVADLKVLFTTGYARNAIVHQGRLDAGVHLLTKPFTYEELAARVRDILDGRA